MANDSPPSESPVNDSYLAGILRSVVGVPWFRAKAALTRNRYRQNASSQTLDWPWGEVHYNRVALVNLLVSKVDDCDYLEIGCDTNGLFDAVAAPNKVGVDPRRGGNVRKTSDEFFRDNRKTFDVVFIDGLHTYEQVHRDIVNAIRVLKPGGWVALHDMLPRNWMEHHVPVVTTGKWTGDVWKTGFELAQTEGIDFKIIKMDFGVGVFRLTHPSPRLVDLKSELEDKQFPYFVENLARLPVIEWKDCKEWLRKR